MRYFRIIVGLSVIVLASMVMWSIGGRTQISPGSISSSQVISALGFTPLNPANNLSDVSSAPSSATTLGMGSASNVSVGSMTLTTGAYSLAKITASGTAPGAGMGKVELVCGTNSGTAKLIIYAGTSGTAVTIVDNIGTGVTGC